MIISPFVLVENCGILRKDEAVCFGIPLAKGTVKNIEDVALKYQEHILAIQKQATQWWCDGSIRWLLIEFYATLQPHETKEYTICIDKSHKNPALTSNISWKLLSHKQHFISIEHQQNFYKLSAAIIDQKNQQHDISLSLQKDLTNNIRTTLFLQGYVLRKCLVKLYLHIFRDYIMCEVSLHNFQRAKHKSGLWDLGDPGAFMFRDFSLRINTDDICATTTNLTSGNLENFVIYQDSSGGENWNSVNHINSQQKVTTSFCGYRIYDNGQQISQGKRAQPQITLQHKHGFSNIAIENFWQNFPKAIARQKNNIELRFFPKNCSNLFELQGGEQKTHRFYMAFNKELPTKKLQPVLPASYYETTKTIHFFSPQKTPVDDMVNNAVYGENSFEKRNESIDEYGWRNFGDFFADHEAVNHKTSTFISHYNNQYDLIYGFYLQYIRTGNASWFRLMTNLAQHVIDIDIYRTTDDKSAYNHGLFWHTNHYLPAQTATHRCYSQLHLQQTSSPNSYGGGPSNEHNYTTGLTYFYVTTGHLQAKEAVLLLANWVLDMEDGSKSIFALIDKSDTGLSSQTYSPNYHGPGRGSANSINALIDAYSLTQDEKYLLATEKLIKRCISPDDNFEELKLCEPEARWSYTVFLQILGKYLMLKEERGDYDEMYCYGVLSLLHYAHWMVNNEYFYLDIPEKLEYPTETWAAQELRKVHVFFLANQYQKNALFLQKMDYFYHRAFDTLQKQYPCHKDFVRPIAIVMHWGNIYHYAQTDKTTKNFADLTKKVNIQKPVFISQKSRVKSKIKMAIKILGMAMLVLLTILVVLYFFA